LKAVRIMTFPLALLSGQDAKTQGNRGGLAGALHGAWIIFG